MVGKGTMIPWGYVLVAWESGGDWNVMMNWNSERRERREDRMDQLDFSRESEERSNRLLLRGETQIFAVLRELKGLFVHLSSLIASWISVWHALLPSSLSIVSLHVDWLRSIGAHFTGDHATSGIFQTCIHL
ncbi:hypothetical protein PMAYCL1PPCAC_02426, partial [Pristionchus mayeri]